MMYDVTIALPVYNAERHLYDTMQSALAQDYRSIEFLILDDCGTDGSIDIIHQLQQTHPRGKDIRIVSQEFNKGVGAARNRILKEASGRFLYFLDADDIIKPNTISLMMSAAKKYDAEVVLASHERIELYHEEPKSILYQFPFKVFSKRHMFATYAFSRYGALNANIWNVLIDMRLVRQNRLRFVNSNFWEDMEFKYEIVTHVVRAVLLSDVTYSYMCRENTLSNFQKREIIDKDEVLRNVATLDVLKGRYEYVLWKPYFTHWLQFVLDTDFFIISDVLKHRLLIQPSISDKELLSFLYSPLSLYQTLVHGNMRIWFYKFLPILPARLAVSIISKKH